MRLRSLLLAALTLAASAGTGVATEYYVAPLGTVLTCTATGTQACPWPSVAAAFSSKKILGGDTVLLMDGSHGPVDINYQIFETAVRIQSMTDRNAHLASVNFGDATKKITLRNLKIWRPDSDTGTGYLVRAYSGSSYLTFENLELRSREDSTNYLNWSLARWTAVATNAFDLRGSYSIVRNNTVTGVNAGIYAGPNSLVENNVIDGFSSDGMKGVSESTFRNNVVKNSFNVFPDYHRDGFQSYTPGAPITNLVLDGNTILQWTHGGDHPLKAPLQGIGLFDGFYDDLVIRNNLVVTQHSHGISVYGTRRATIVNNTVVNLDGLVATVPWIKVAPHSDGTPSQDVLVGNNLAMQFQGTPSTENNVAFKENSVILNPALAFEDIATFNYRPKATSGFIDTGNVTYAPPLDIIGAARPAGAGPDRGAYEVGGTGGTTGDGTGGTGDGTTTPPSSDGAKFVKVIRKK